MFSKLQNYRVKSVRILKSKHFDFFPRCTYDVNGRKLSSNRFIFCFFIVQWAWSSKLRAYVSRLRNRNSVPIGALRSYKIFERNVKRSHSYVSGAMHFPRLFISRNGS